MNITKTHTSLVAAFTLALCAAPGALAGPNADKHFQKMDSDGDGKITRAEHAAGAKKMFTESDKNKDGIVTAAEMDAAMALKGIKPDASEKSSAEKIKVIDQNADGKLTMAEHNAGTEKMFAKMDTDGDGALSKEECEAGLKDLKHDKPHRETSTSSSSTLPRP